MSLLRNVVFVDLETKGIEPRPAYPPEPVGLAIREPGRAPVYYAFGHASDNTCDERLAISAYRNALRGGAVPCFHHAGFDLDVIEQHWGIGWPREWHDTLLLAFLDDPFSTTFSLKPLAEKLLNEPPAERDELLEWILANVPEAKRKPSTAMAYIWRAPGKTIAARYAKGDVTRTQGLFDRYKRTVLMDTDLCRAYERELKLTPVLIAMESRGIPIATRRLGKDIERYTEILAGVEHALLKKLKVPKADWEDFTWSGERFADALERAGKVTEWLATPKGGRATGHEELEQVCDDSKLVAELEVRAQLQTCLSTFMQPWYDQASGAGDGKFFARFNQVRQDHHGGGRQVGAVTGRLSMTPNLQNVIRKKDDKRVPQLRDYIEPPRERKLRRWLVQRDYSQQELRILADYEGGAFLNVYLNNPTIDGHVAVGQLLTQLTGVVLDRRDVKDLNFGLIYGMGNAKLARKLKRDLKSARELSKAHLRALPGIGVVRENFERLADANEPFYTWGGRRYYCERGRLRDGRWMTFEYKMLNTYVQGSAADATKQAMVNYWDAGHDARWPLILQVHDELLISAPKREVRAAHEALRDAMADLNFKLPMLSDGKAGARSWATMKKVTY